jgi:hypothetical protein
MGACLMCCGVPFTKDEFKNGLRRSFQSNASQLCQMDPDTVEEVREKIAESKGMKTKPGKKPWTEGATYYYCVTKLSKACGAGC